MTTCVEGGHIDRAAGPNVRGRCGVCDAQTQTEAFVPAIYQTGVRRSALSSSGGS